MPIEDTDAETELQRFAGAHWTRDKVEDIDLHFREFAPADAAPEMVAVDGSYTFLLNLSSWWLAMLETGAIRYAADGGYRVTGQRRNHRMVAVSTREDFIATQTKIHQMVFDFTRGRKDQANEMVNEFRRLAETELAFQTASDHQGLILALDGALASFPKDYNNLMEDLVRACERNGHLLVGVSKDSELHTFGSALSDEDLLRRRQGEGPGCAYVRAPAAVDQRQKALLHGDVYYARLHPNSPKWFRVDLGTQKDDPAAAFAKLSAYCRARHALGYPMPLMEAHRMVVTVRHLQPVYEQRVLRAAVALGLDLREVVNGLTRHEGKRKSAYHEYLDRLTGDRM